MRILTVPPGPQFAVADVHRGWTDALARLVDVRSFNFDERLMFHEEALRGKVDENERGHVACRQVAEQLRGACFDYQPDALVITSGFFVPPETYDIIRSRGIKIVVLLTESPYEDPAQYHIAARADLAFINDPTNLETFRQHQPQTYYLPHAYDPARHRPLEPSADLICDFGWVGTAFPSRIAFFEAVDWRDADVALAGNWQQLSPESPLNEYLVHDDGCFHNDATVELYSSCKVSANIYRKEAVSADHSDGWAVGPREVELAACGTFFLREPRGEGDEMFPFLPTFGSPEDFGDQLAWWLAHDLERTAAARLAREAVADFTFDNRAKFLLDKLGI